MWVSLVLFHLEWFGFGRKFKNWGSHLTIDNANVLWLCVFICHLIVYLAEVFEKADVTDQ